MFKNDKGADFSECKKYRYSLLRKWSNKPLLLFIMLNPSTADSNIDDPTIKKCIYFSKKWGFGGIMVGNLFAYRSTDPKKLKKVTNPEGADNKRFIKKMVANASTVICAWGNGYGPPPSYLKRLTELHYLKINKDGTPAHPLYLKKSLMYRKY